MVRVKRAASEMDQTGKSGLDAMLRNVLDRVQELSTEDESRLLSSAFIKLPPKKVYPDYYALIEQPISLFEILRKVTKGSYRDVALLVADFTLMYENALRYNDPTSWIVQDARQILDYVEANVDTAALAVGTASSEPDLNELRQMCLGILEEVIEHLFPDDGVLSGPFMYNVDPEEYPEYYTIIEHPTSFEQVKEEVNGLLFSASATLADNLSAFYNEVDLIFINAQTYNDPSALIFEDLRKLLQVFNEKYAALELSLLGELHPALKFKGKGPKEPTTKLKLTFKGKTESPGPEDFSYGDDAPKKKRGRKPKKVVEEEQRQAALEAQLKREAEGGYDSEDEYDNGLFGAFEAHAMGKHFTIPPKESVFIRKVGFSSNQNVTNQILSAVGSQAYAAPSKAEITRRQFFPEAPVSNGATFFDYQFETLGFSSKAYSITLPQDATPIVSMKVALHEFIYNLKKNDLVDGQGYLKGRAEEDFMASLFVNDEEVGGGVEVNEEIDPTDNRTKLLSLSYDLKLSYGLNIVNFELRLSPTLAKTLRKRKGNLESTELAGRHTRHQLQQLKLHWEMEKFTLYVISLSP